MPTGYTSRITAEMPFADFAMDCARAFGALIEMRDSPGDAPIPKEFKPSGYSEKALLAAQKELARIELLHVDRIAAEYAVAKQERAESMEKSRRDSVEDRAKYERMLAMVRQWDPPTSEHRGLKKFMVEQIEETIRYDCPEDRDSLRWNPELPSMARWHAERVAKAKRDVIYYRSEHEKDVARAQERTAWVRDLRESLGL